MLSSLKSFTASRKSIEIGYYVQLHLSKEDPQKLNNLFKDKQVKAKYFVLFYSRSGLFFFLFSSPPYLPKLVILVYKSSKVTSQLLHKGTSSYSISVLKILFSTFWTLLPSDNKAYYILHNNILHFASPFSSILLKLLHWRLPTTFPWSNETTFFKYSPYLTVQPVSNDHSFPRSYTSHSMSQISHYFFYFHLNFKRKNDKKHVMCTPNINQMS